MSNPAPASFLPEDYLNQRAETKANIINLILFGVVLFGVIGAFFVTNRQWASVRAKQTEINAQFSAEAPKIDQLKALSTQKAEMLEKAEVTTALIERVPRSILLAELINRMPERLTLSDIQVASRRLADPLPKTAQPGGAPKSLSSTPASDGTPAKPKPPRYQYTITLIGLSASDEDVADYQAALKDCPLITGVDLASSMEQKVNDVPLRKFRIEATIRSDADARRIEPLQVPRLRSVSPKALTNMAKEPKPAPAPSAHTGGREASFNESPLGSN
jgi:Tfp pilus assembly protein PilN